jgi:delta 1-pyrroline-5-carboxylate dehydrogenase
MSETTAAPRAANFVAGQWTQSRDGATYERRNPWRPSEVVGEFPSSGADDVDASVGAAAAAWPGWSALAAARRGAILARAADVIESRVEEIAQEMTREMASRCVRRAPRRGAQRRSCGSSRGRGGVRSGRCSSSRRRARPSTPGAGRWASSG